MLNVGFKLTFITKGTPLHILLTIDTAIYFIENISDVLYASESINNGGSKPKSPPDTGPVFINMKITFKAS